MPDVAIADAAAIERATVQLTRVRDEISKIIVGQRDVVDGVLICLLAGGHVLLEGVPGLGKTTLLRTLARVLHLKYSRIQFTPDLMPGDIVGSMIMETDDQGHRVLRFQPGPIFANLVLADEINRATPKTQSALARGDAGAHRDQRHVHVFAGTAVSRDGHAESHRDGGHLSAARSATRPVSDEDSGHLSHRATISAGLWMSPLSRKNPGCSGLESRRYCGAEIDLPAGDRCAACAGVCHRPGDGDAARIGDCVSYHEPVYTLWQFAARRPGADRMRARSGSDERASPSQH